MPPSLFYQTRLILVVLWVLILAVSCKQESPKPEDPVDSSSPNLSSETLRHDGVDRTYLLYVPDAYDSSLAVPLMLNFHGYGMTANQQMRFADMRPQADAHNFILVYPQGTRLAGDPHWNAGLEGPDNKSDADDFGFVEALLDELVATYSIDLERVYACGYSNGAFFSYSLACFHSDKIAAIGSVAGTMLEETYNNCSPEHPTAMINLHGTADFSVPYEGNSEGLVSIENVMEYWTSFNNTLSTPLTGSVTTPKGELIEQYVYPEGEKGISVAHYKVVQGGHEWFELSYEGANTSQLIWDFVSQYDINGLR